MCSSRCSPASLSHSGEGGRRLDGWEAGCAQNRVQKLVNVEQMHELQGVFICSQAQLPVLLPHCPTTWLTLWHMHSLPYLPCRLEAAQLPDKLAVTNGANAKQRLLLRNAAVQLEDEYGNAAPGGGVQVPRVGSWLGVCSSTKGQRD